MDRNRIPRILQIKPKERRNTGHFIMICMITNIYNKKTKGPTLMELFNSHRKTEKVIFDN
jgi:hypothetical protein